jgi:glycosyltransferase involved in cell wall biosynthesis
MRVALVNHTGEISGAEVSLLGTADALARAGVRLVLVVPEAGELASRARARGHEVRSTPLPAPRFTSNPFTLSAGALGLARAARDLARIIRREGVDLVHANSVRAGLIASFGSSLHARPVVWSVRDFVPTNPVGLAVRLLAGRAATIIGNSDAVSTDFSRWPWLRAKTRTIYPSLAPEAFDISPGADFRASWGVAAHAKVVGCVGQIAPWKRVHDVIAAFARVATRVPSARLAVVGAPKFRPENQDYLRRLRSLVAESGLDGRVVFAGYQEDIEGVFRTLDVLAHAAEREPFGRVLVEAMAQRVPVVAMADGGVPEIVRDGETGFLVPPGDVDAMGARILDLLKDDARRRRIGEAGRARALESFHADLAARRLVETYRAVLRE